MLKVTGHSSLDDLTRKTVPKEIYMEKQLDLKSYTKGLSETEFLGRIKAMADKNVLYKNFIGLGYYGTLLPTVIQRNLLENPGWYTQYTPYQSEIAQGRLESLLNFQTMISDLTGMELSNSSLLDEGTAAAEAMGMCLAIGKHKKTTFLISNKCHPQTIDNCQTRALGLGINVKVVDEDNIKYDKDVCGVLVQYPASDGTVKDYSKVINDAKSNGVITCMATDLLALTKLKPPAEYGVDIAIGSAQRFGVPMGYGGPHAAFLATSSQHKRLMPGRLIGVSQDTSGRPALRMAMQTREQHIRREKATSNICTAQALLANISAMYAVYHGPEGLNKIADKVNGLAKIFQAAVQKIGYKIDNDVVFDTIKVDVDNADQAVKQLLDHQINVRKLDHKHVCVSFDETHTLEDLQALLEGFNNGPLNQISLHEIAEQVQPNYGGFERQSKYLQQRVFNVYHSEHELLRYLKRLENRDLSLCHSMIPLGSCTMKLNATSEMIPITWGELAHLHPFVPVQQAQGYQEILEDFAQQLCEITQFDAVSFQPNAGASGEYAGLMSIQAYHRSRGDHGRKVCLIPTSAHGTNPASAIMSGMTIVNVNVGHDGYVDTKDLKAKAEKHKDELGAFMITYPSTCGVYEEGVEEICKIIHQYGGQVYMDGANMNAQVGLTAPGLIGADVCHLNLHKTFCIPHGGGGPGMGPIGVKKHLAKFLPGHPVIKTHGMPSDAQGVQGEELKPFGSVAAAPYGSSLILPISFAYVSMMGADGLKGASERAILNANYMAKVLSDHYPIVYTGKNGTCAHEFLLDLRHLKQTANIEAEDIAKRLIDYGYHSPTMSWPVAGTLMIEPTESESKAELDRFCQAMISIRNEIKEVEEGKYDKNNNVLKNSPHTAHAVLSDKWDKPYGREKAAFPAYWTQVYKFWPTVSRVDNVGGDRNLVAKLLREHDGKFAAW